MRGAIPKLKGAARGFEIIEEFIERGASARDDRRPQFQTMIEPACQKQKPFDVIMVDSFSRVFQDEVHFELYHRKLEKYDAEIISIAQEMSAGPGGEITGRVIALMDEMRSKEDAKHVKRGMKENARQGFWNGAVAPFGSRPSPLKGEAIRSRKSLQSIRNPLRRSN